MKTSIRKALANSNLRGALDRFADAYVSKRLNAYKDRDFEALREQIATIKGSAAQQMEELAQEFKKNATARGAQVFIAKTAEEARNYIREVAIANNIKLIIKSKSMATEEISLNHFLEEEDIEVVESDLGEWIIQLAGERPSHMLMPAIHMTRDEVADIFSKKTGKYLTGDIPKLVSVARDELRGKFLSAGMGITGVNIAVAKTGTIVIVANEGNVRLTTTLPPVHVALVGMEKLVEKFSDVRPILECLPRSATGQQLTSYITMINGAVPTISTNGVTVSKKLHIVLMDNGRTKLKEDPLFREALQCIRCASCLNVCPIFQLVGGHVYGSVYTGGIGTILTAFFNDFNDAGTLQNLCIGCGRCQEICPGKVNVPRMMLELRNRVVAQKGMPAVQGFFLSTMLPNRKLFHAMLKVAAKAQKPFIKDNKVRHLPLFLARLTKGRSLPALADQPFRNRLNGLLRSKKSRTRVGFFGGCLVDFVYPELGEAVNKVLDGMEMELVYPVEQTCCGVPASHLGATDAAVSIAKQNIIAFEEVGADYIITACPTCTSALKYEFGKLLANDSIWTNRIERFAAKVHDFSKFIAVHTHKGKRLNLKSGGQERVTYHDSCHLRRHLGIYKEPRELIAAAGMDLKEMNWSDRCCGFGGSYSIKYPEVSQQILEQKIGNIIQSNVDVVVTDCPGCIMQIGGGLDQKNVKIQIKHTAVLLAERLPH